MPYKEELINSIEPNFIFDKKPINRFRFNVAAKYPVRTYTTASRFTGTNYLPTQSYYAVKDLDTNEFVIDYDTTYTQISSDVNGNYDSLPPGMTSIKTSPS